MFISRKFPQKNCQLFIAVIFGMVFSLCLNELFRSSTVTWEVIYNERNNTSTTPSQTNITSTLPSQTNITSTLPSQTNITETIPSPTNITETVLSHSFNKNIRVLCWVMTCAKYHRTKAIHVKRTWGKRCDKLLFISSHQDPEIDSIAIPGADDGYDRVWGKTKAAFKYAYEHHWDEFDWIMKADDDTYVIMENLKKFLSNYSTSDPIYFGCQLRTKDFPSFPYGGPGYVLSKEALRRFVVDALPNNTICREDDSGNEDREVGRCLLNVGVTLEDSRDFDSRHRFIANEPRDHLFPRDLSDSEESSWYWQELVYPQPMGMNCCASDAISYHHIPNKDMYTLEHFIYHMRPHGVEEEPQYVQEYPLELPEFNATQALT